MVQAFSKSAAAKNFVCDAITPLTNFNAAAYMGDWYEQQHVKNQRF